MNHPTTQQPNRRSVGGYREGMHGCPTCGTILNAVHCHNGNSGYTGALLVCPTAIGEQVHTGAGHHAFPTGSLHRKLAYWVDEGGKLAPYVSYMGFGYGYNGKLVQP